MAQDGPIRLTLTPTGEDGATLCLWQAGRSRPGAWRQQPLLRICQTGCRIARTGSPWRDSPCAFGNWITADRAERWAKAGRLRKTHVEMCGLELFCGTGVRHGRCHHRLVIHRHGQRKKGTQSQPLAALKGGMTNRKSRHLPTRSYNLRCVSRCLGSVFRYGRTYGSAVIWKRLAFDALIARQGVG